MLPATPFIFGYVVLIISQFKYATSPGIPGHLDTWRSMASLQEQTQLDFWACCASLTKTTLDYTLSLLCKPHAKNQTRNWTFQLAVQASQKRSKHSDELTQPHVFVTPKPFLPQPCAIAPLECRGLRPMCVPEKNQNPKMSQNDRWRKGSPKNYSEPSSPEIVVRQLIFQLSVFIYLPRACPKKKSSDRKKKNVPGTKWKSGVDVVSKQNFVLEIQVEAVRRAPNLFATLHLDPNLQSGPIEGKPIIARLLYQPIDAQVVSPRERGSRSLTQHDYSQQTFQSTYMWVGGNKKTSQIAMQSQVAPSRPAVPLWELVAGSSACSLHL